ncbi:hypothetical protein T484DRAFT_1779581 [Baffinella frigidus]|nr:hypothetical protein T484DRAFT_1779581 [Cryptophyta sp. CCMP2293]
MPGLGPGFWRWRVLALAGIQLDDAAARDIYARVLLDDAAARDIYAHVLVDNAGRVDISRLLPKHASPPGHFGPPGPIELGSDK